jgi:23S rRNA (uracil1939-C5)-methyltransferase
VTVHKLEIERVAYGGEGVARLPDGKVAFVRGGLPGDVVDVEIHKEKKRFAKGLATKVVAAGEGRFTTACPHVDDVGHGCGGCHFQSAHYAFEWQWKAAAALDAFSRAARTPLDGVDIVRHSSPAPEGYRRRLRVHIDRRGTVGFFSSGSHFIAGPASDCLVAHPTLRRAAEVLKLRGPGTALLELDAGEEKVVVRAQVPRQPTPTLTAPIVGIELVSKESDPQSVGTLEFELDVRGQARTLRVGAFTQANARMNDVLVTSALMALDLSADERVLELYCGAGNFTLDIARQGGRVVAVDVGASAIEAGRAAAQRHGLTDRIQWEVGNLRRGLPELDGAFDAVLLDPPRSGAKDVAEAIAALACPKVVYVSCDAPTAGRDVGQLLQSGYTIERITLVDMFPRTSHVELVVALRRGASDPE